MLPPIRDYDGLVRRFRWRIPTFYNIGADIADRWARADPDRPAILDVAPDGGVTAMSFAALSEASSRFANALRARSVAPGDRVGILLPQGAAVAVAHAAIYKLGAIAVPMATVFGAGALRYRLADAGVTALVTQDACLDRIRAVRSALPALRLVVSTDGADGSVEGYAGMLAAASPDFRPLRTRADDPAMMIYTSGTTGPPKGALHAHRVLLGHLPGLEFAHEFMPQPGDRVWTPADWAWAGGLLNVLLPSLHLGITVVARKFEKFEAEPAFRLMADLGVRNAFIPPTALRMLRAIDNPRGRFAIDLRTVVSAGETLGPETFAFAREALGVTVNELYGQTECNLVLGSSALLGVSRAGSTGRPIPGHRVAIIRPDGSLCLPGEIGQIAVARPDPVMFLGYWNNAAATESKFLGEWMTTGDQAVADEDGYVRFIGRDDDVITSSGYRIGPGEVEECLLGHPAVALAAAIGKPDPLRTEIVKAFVVLKHGYAPSAALAAEIQDFVRDTLSRHEYPREIAFRADLPLTSSGKVIRRILRDEA